VGDKECGLTPMLHPLCQGLGTKDFALTKGGGFFFCERVVSTLDEGDCNWAKGSAIEFIFSLQNWICR
jgi:hypothetical protein